MRDQGRPPETPPANSWRSLWRQSRLPLAVGSLIGLTASILTAMSFGITPHSIFLISCMAGSALGMPIIILLIGRYMESHYES